MFEAVIAAALATQAPYIHPTPGHDELAFTSPTSQDCVARFDNGTLEVRQAYDRSGGTITDVAVMTVDKASDYRAGAHLLIGPFGGPLWNARVISKTPSQITVATGIRALGEMVMDQSPTLTVYEPAAMDKGVAGLLVLGDESGNGRSKIVDLLNRADGMGL